MTASRREFLGQAARLAALATLMHSGNLAGPAAAQQLYGPASEFRDDFVRKLAQDMASKPYVDEKIEMPPDIDISTYDQYRDIRFRADRSIWKGEPHSFSLDLFHPGFIFTKPVDIYLVEDGQQAKLNYDPTLFEFGPHITKVPQGQPDLHYAGFRVRYPINNADVNDEFLVFQGASYFRAVGKGLLYGLSARGLAIDTGEPSGEEFPFFRAFWVKKPEAATGTLVIEALLDSPSATGAYRFTVKPGEDTQMDVEMTLFPRRDIATIGIAPLTSMFLFDALARPVEDFRNAVHDSDGLMMLTGRREWLWRPLANPKTLQVSAFQDMTPQGFGLMQRKRSYQDFLDLEARYERRPSLWVEPIGDWGPGFVLLYEIPTFQEINDNIVTFWRPKEPLKQGASYNYVYRMHWFEDWPKDEAPPARIVTFSGSGVDSNNGLVPPKYDANLRYYVIEYSGGEAPGKFTADISASAGTVSKIVIYPNPINNTMRLSFAHDATGVDSAELRAVLKLNDAPAAETWLYRWTRL